MILLYCKLSADSAGETIFTRRRSFAEYWKYFVARFNYEHHIKPYMSS